MWRLRVETFTTWILSYCYAKLCDIYILLSYVLLQFLLSWFCMWTVDGSGGAYITWLALTMASLACEL
jgi:hypothetical protein